MPVPEELWINLGKLIIDEIFFKDFMIKFL